MTKISLSLASEYGIMFLHDSKHTPTVPSGAGRQPIMSTPTCLAFSVLIYVDGDAAIVLCDRPEMPDEAEYFCGEIACPSQALSLSDHNGFVYASVPLTEKHALVSLRMTEQVNPDLVECAVLNLKAF